MVNAAGVYPPSSLDDYAEESYRHIFDVNVLGTVDIIAETQPALRASGSGAVVNFASVDGFSVSRGQLLYSASKVVVSLPRSLAIELGDDNITVKALPRFDTPGTRGRRAHGAGTRNHPVGKGRTAGEDRRLSLETLPRHLHDRRNARGQRRTHARLTHEAAMRVKVRID